MQLMENTFLITGAASGLGAASARRIVNAGGRVVLCDLQDSVADQARELGEPATFCKGDITSDTDMQQVIKTCVAHSQGRGLAGVVHCAGIVSVAKLVDRDGHPASLEAYSKTVNINLVGTFNIMRLAAAAMVTNTPGVDGERGVIINTASIAAFDGQTGQCAYSASKAGVAGMSLPAARELSRYGIRVMAIAPGVFETPMMSDIPVDAVKSLSAAVPFPKRLGKPEEFALMVEQIIVNAMLNGEVIRLDGGIRMQ